MTHQQILGREAGATLTDAEWAQAESALSGTNANVDQGRIDQTAGLPIREAATSISGITNNQAAPTAAPATSLGGLVGPAVAAAGQPAVNPQVNPQINPQINPQANPQAAASLGGMTAGAQPIANLSSLASGQANPYAGGNAAWMRDSAGLSPQQKSRMWGTTPGFYTS